MTIQQVLWGILAFAAFILVNLGALLLNEAL